MRILPIIAVMMALSFVEHCRAMPFLRHHENIVLTKTRFDGWALEIARNPFSERQTCNLRATNNRAFYANGAAAFRFRPRWNVREAVYRLDGAAPRHNRNDVSPLLALKVPIDRGGMDNASGGLVWIPYDRLVAANQVTIQPQPGRKLTDFQFRGLRSLHDIAIARGCVPERRFVE